MPLPRGRIFDPQRCIVQLSGTEARPQEAQVRVHARWPDRSARWALIDTVIPAGISGPQQLVSVTLTDQPQPKPEGLICKEKAGEVTITSPHLRVMVRTGNVESALTIEQHNQNDEWQVRLPTVPGKGLHFETVLGNGVQLETGPLANLCLEERGHQRAVIYFTLDHCDARGIAHLRSAMRMHIYADQKIHQDCPSPFRHLTHACARCGR